MWSGSGANGAACVAAARVVAAVVLLSAGGCGHLPAMHWPSIHWPWHHRPPPAPAPVHELDISAGAGASVASDAAGAYPQYWNRNTLVVDLSAASGSGGVMLKPAAGSAWPVRLAFRVTPGSIGLLSVRGDQRLVIPVTPAAGKPIELELAPHMYTSKTAQILVSWGPNSPPVP
jgi:hypothetical protein